MFAELNRQLARDTVAMFKHPKPLYFCVGDAFAPFDAIRETMDQDIEPGVMDSVVKRFGFQVTGETWRRFDEATAGQPTRFLVERDGDFLNRYQVDGDKPFDEITSDGAAVRINTVLTKSKEPIDDDFTGRILPTA